MRCDKVDARNSWRVFVCGAVILRLGKITKHMQGYDVDGTCNQRDVV